jgi:hypothetical protein
MRPLHHGLGIIISCFEIILTLVIRENTYDTDKTKAILEIQIKTQCLADQIMKCRIYNNSQKLVSAVIIK